jgi:hypothetical protein
MAGTSSIKRALNIMRLVVLLSKMANKLYARDSISAGKYKTLCINITLPHGSVICAKTASKDLRT